MHGRHLTSKSLDLVLGSLKEKKGPFSFEGETLYVAETGMAIWVPFGMVAFCFALPAARPSMKTPVDVNKLAKGHRPKRSKADDMKYASHVWLPIMSELDAGRDGKMVSWAYSFLRSTQSCLSKKYMERSGHDKWMEALGKVATTMAAEEKPKKKPAVSLEDADSEEEDSKA